MPFKNVIICLSLILLLCFSVSGQAPVSRTLSGTVLTSQNEVVPGVSVLIRYPSGEQRVVSDASGRFNAIVPYEPVSLRFFGRKIALVSKSLAADAKSDDLEIRVEYLIPPIHESVVIQANALDPAVDRLNDTVYKSTLFLRDDQLLQTLNAGINAGQHEGGGKSLEIRRFGFNLDHGGVNGGLKVLVDDVQQNQGTQGHGQGYLGQLKSLTPELVQDVDILNGPFSAQYGDFSGLGVVHIRLKESLPDQLTLRMQGGSFNTYRTFLAYSPAFKRADAFVAYEGSRTDGPFLNPLRYKRENLTASYTYKLSDKEAAGFKLNLGRNDFFSSGQIPLDEVAAGQLDRFGFLDPNGGGRVRTALTGVYYRKELARGRTFKADAFLGRSLFDLYSNFTFFLNDPINGDEIQQHDSRLQEGANVQFLQPYKLWGNQALLTAGGSFHANQINVGLSRTVARNPFEPVTSAHVNLTNGGGYVQNGLDLIHGHMHIEAGLRIDYFRFDVDNKIAPDFSGSRNAAPVQPKFSISYAPADNFPAVFFFNYGRGISTQDARSVIQYPDSPAVSTTDFYQLGTSHRLGRFSASTDLFLIDRSNEQVYIPDDGSVEFKGPSRAYGYEIKTALGITKQLSFNSGITQVMNAFFKGTTPRVYIDSSPHTVANGGLTLSLFKGFTGMIGYRHISNYRLDGEDPSIRASGLDVLDFSLNKQIRRWIDFNLAIDNVLNKRFFETQNYFESRVTPLGDAAFRVHATPGYPFGITAGITLRLFGKN